MGTPVGPVHRALGRAIAPALAVSFCIALFAAADAGAQDYDTPAAAVAALNAQRERNGIPSGIVENADWSDRCRKHMNYIAVNGGELTHEEESPRPGYTPEGAWAGNTSVLSSVGFGPRGENPWEDAPIHLMQLLAPELAETGYWKGCMVTWAGYNRPAPAQPQLVTYPGDGTREVDREQSTAEIPYTPAEYVGLKNPTGPTLYVLAWGLEPGPLTDASLTGPEGPVGIRTVDNTTSGPRGNIGAYLPPGGIIVPAKPLKGNTTYAARATFGGLSHTWTITTKPRTPQLQVGADERGLGVISDSAGPIDVRLKRRGSEAFAQTLNLTPGSPAYVPVPAALRGRYDLCYSQGP
jgi:hypothetical protein